jgi:hypothetical protein
VNERRNDLPLLRRAANLGSVADYAFGEVDVEVGRPTPVGEVLTPLDAAPGGENVHAATARGPGR